MKNGKKILIRKITKSLNNQAFLFHDKKRPKFFQIPSLFVERCFYTNIHLVPYYTICSGKELQELGSKTLSLTYILILVICTRKIKHKLHCTRIYVRF